MHFSPCINGGFVNFSGVGDKFVRLPRDRNPNTQQWGCCRGLELLTSLADAEGGLHREPGSTQGLHMAVKNFAEVKVGLAQGNAACSMGAMLIYELVVQRLGIEASDGILEAAP